MTTLYISPHLDDAVLACAGGMLARRRAGRAVTVVSVFTRTGTEAVDRRRAAENIRAMRLIGASHFECGFLDAPARAGVPETFRGLVLDARVNPDTVAEVRDAVATFARGLRPDEIWLPLGVGGHVDHLTVFAARDAFPGAGVRFYFERPYAFVPALVALRRLQLAGGHLRAPPDPDMLARQLSDGACGAFAVAPEDLADLAAELARPHAGVGLLWHPRLASYAAATLPPAAAVIRAYTSQVRWLLGDARADTVTAAWRRLARAPRGDRWCERYLVAGAGAGDGASPTISRRMVSPP